MYLSCPKKYEFSYVMRLPRVPSMPLAIGKGGHAALEYNAKQKIKTASDIAMEELLDIASDQINAEVIQVPDKTTKASGQNKDRALAGIRIFRERDAPKIQPAGVEVPFLLQLSPETRPIKGFIDIIDTSRAVDDYKFVSRRKSQADVDLSPQLTLYSKVFHTITGTYPSNVGFRQFLPGNKSEAPDTEVIRRSAELMTPAAQEARFKRMEYQFAMVEKGIEAGVFPPTDNPQTCSYCDFRTRCQSSLVKDDFQAAKIRGEI